MEAKQKSRIVVKDNALIDASFNLSLVEQRIMHMAIVEGRELNKLTPDTPIEIQVKNYMDLYKVSSSTAYETIFDSSKKLKRREFTYLDKYKGFDAVSTANWVNKVTYVKGNGMIAIYLSAEVISMISRLEEQFTRFSLEETRDFDCKYSVRLYEIMMKWISSGVSEKYEISDLRAKLGIENNEYKTMSLFKVNALDKAVGEINKHTDISVKYEQFRTGRSITHFMFKIRSKRVIKTVNEPKELTFKMSQKQINLFAQKLANDKIFGGKWGIVGETVEELELRLLNELLNIDRCRKYSDHLLRLGYSEGSKIKKVA